MRSPAGSVLVALLLLGLHAPGASTQVLPRPSDDTVASSAAVSSHEAAPVRHSFLSRVGTAVGGALLGAGIGFFASQVVVGDWDQRDGDGTINRAAWAEMGGALGFTLGFSFPIGGHPGTLGASGPSPSQGRELSLPGGRDRITAEEIAGSDASTAYDVVKNLRSDWLLRRPTQALDTNEEDDIRVYLDSQFLGGLDALSTIPAVDVRAMYRFDAAQASIRWGAGHQEGAILIVSKH